MHDPCSDCAAPYVDHHMQHEPTCPQASDLATVMSIDSYWFRDNPDALHCCRWCTRPERNEIMDVYGVQVGGDCIVHVEKISEGIRELSFYVPGDELVPEASVALWGHPHTFNLIEDQVGEVMFNASKAVLDCGLQAVFFRVPEGMEVGERGWIDGLMILSGGEALPVPAGIATRFYERDFIPKDYPSSFLTQSL